MRKNTSVARPAAGAARFARLLRRCGGNGLSSSAPDSELMKRGVVMRERPGAVGRTFL
jgi:hypothetical protein